MTTDGEVEELEVFRQRARAWLAEHLPRVDEHRATPRADDGERLAHHRTLQRRLFEGGFAGICFPTAYGGQGLTPAHQAAFTDEADGYELPVALNVPTLGILAATLLEFGSEAQKRRHLPAILRGDEYWIQFLSEPTGGSDIAGALTSATRDGDEWVLTGSKVWSTHTHHADYALCLARTNWDVPKHAGLTVFIVAIRQPRVEVRQIEMINGSREFCEVFLSDVRIPADAVVGDVDGGWGVMSRWMFHERIAVGGGSPYTSGRGGDGAHGPDRRLFDFTERRGLLEDPLVRQLVGEAYAYGVVQDELIRRITTGIAAGVLPDPATTILRLFKGMLGVRTASIALDVAGRAATAWAPDDEAIDAIADGFLLRQVSCIGGGTTEMARNVLSERLLGMPREPAADRGLPFREARTNARPR